MITSLETPSVFHGGGDDLNHALAHLSWKEMVLGVAIVFGIFLITILLALITNPK
jgi:hypothetical protein